VSSVEYGDFGNEVDIYFSEPIVENFDILESDFAVLVNDVTDNPVTNIGFPASDRITLYCNIDFIGPSSVKISYTATTERVEAVSGKLQSDFTNKVASSA